MKRCNSAKDYILQGKKQQGIANQDLSVGLAGAYSITSCSLRSNWNTVLVQENVVTPFPTLTFLLTLKIYARTVIATHSHT